MTPTRDECITAAGKTWAEGELLIREGTVEEAARRSYGFTSGRFSIEEMTARIQATRDADRDAQARRTA